MKRKGDRAAEAFAKRFGAKIKPNSGALDGAKGDLELDKFLVESKATFGDSLRLSKLWLDQIAVEAREVSLHPALAIQFVSGTNEHLRRRGSWVAIPEDAFLEMYDAYTASRSKD